MIHNNIEFHNVAELVPLKHPNGLAMYRYPRSVIASLSHLGHHAAACSDGVEIRFVTDCTWISLTLSARSNYSFSEGAQIEVFRGDSSIALATIPDGATRTIKFCVPPSLVGISREAFTGGRFSPDVWRVRCSGATVIFHDLDTTGEPVRAPRDDEAPATRWLAYGSSITNVTPGYAQHAARLMGVDLLNKGLCGSCQCEPAVAEWLAGCDDWDFTTLELGVNMRDNATPDVLERRTRGMVEELRNASSIRPIVLITMFPTGDDYSTDPTHMTTVNREFRHALRQVHRSMRDPHLHLIEGADVLTDFACLTQDLVHPSVDGHHLMGANLAQLLRPILSKRTERPPVQSKASIPELELM